ncbi:YggS family pyridoxal phosphate-dependent enzyme [Halobacillus sp. A5]|uniref:YggS family pyridoxal phosphate-dependent enzyme n=1 Tax=Halobacillus sp. A5 TaxID=2880263 RepID=UPI0020A659FC|nr:YggS family pyridoxal phosphate-dependent enzyme [Halobacillus sp. A5]MCP3026198.1 YggS family pyridoxal phosphate-dependent enzyme [Halobacillus sp. A5]
MSVAAQLTEMKQAIQEACRTCERNPEDIRIIAVTKYVSIERTIEALEAGISDLGENRREEFLNKYESIGERATWHFIGSLQSRKVKDVIHQIDYLHSLDRKSLAKEVQKRAERTLPCFVQVNVSGEESKQGLPPDEVERFIESLQAYDKIHVVGLMTMAPHVEHEEELRAVFRKLRALRDIIRDKNMPHAPCEHLSMGMSNDFAIAIEEGATHIRVGTSLVG